MSQLALVKTTNPLDLHKPPLISNGLSLVLVYASQCGESAMSLLRDEGCLAVLRDPEGIQRWYRRRLLVTWRC